MVDTTGSVFAAFYRLYYLVKDSLKVRHYYRNAGEKMKGEELKQILKGWQINAAQGAKILCLHSNRMSEYLEDITSIPCAVRFSVEALQLLDDETRRVLFEKRLQRRAHDHN